MSDTSTSRQLGEAADRVQARSRADATSLGSCQQTVQPARVERHVNAVAGEACVRKIDHEITDRAPWVVIRTALVPDFVSRRAGNYTYCYLSALTGSTGACLDQLWVR